MTRTRYRLRLFRCWLRHLGRSVGYYQRLVRWWRRGADSHKPFDTRLMSYNADRLKIALEAWLERQD